MTREETLLAMLDTHEAALWRIARAYGGAQGEEEDLHQEIMLQLWRGLASFRGDSAPGTWLYRVALNTALTWRRRDERRRAHGDPARAGMQSANPGAERTEASILEGFLDSLGAADRSVLVLYMEGLSYEEIGDVIGLSPSAAGVRLHRMKKAFTERYVEG